MKMLACAGIVLGLTGCASVPSANHYFAPAPLRADAVFMGRIVDATDTVVFFGSLGTSAKAYRFEVVGQPGVTVQAVSWEVTCAEQELGDGALLVFAKRGTPDLGPKSQFLVFACPVVDAGWSNRFLEWIATQKATDLWRLKR